MDGTDVTPWSQPRRARAGIGRTYQRTTIFPSFTVLENCRLAAQAAHAEAAVDLGARVRCRVTVPIAQRALEAVGLSSFAQRAAGTLSHGAQRQLEIAMCLATEPRVLLLDEPLAGMGAEETERMLALLLALKEGHAMLLVEHDMDAVFRVADRITVMVNGGVIASDIPRASVTTRRCAWPISARATRDGRRCSKRPACTPTTATAMCCRTPR
jgi:branched-chain amino acid transport system ATP-binding protein